MLALKAEIVVSGHGDPIIGNAEITRWLTRFRNAIQYVHDEVVKGMNSGKDVYPDLVKLAGGAVSLNKLRAGKPVEAPHPADVVIAYDPKNYAALSARLKALNFLQ